MKAGWLYVASIMELFTRKIVGWKADSRMTKELVIDALDQAYQRENQSMYERKLLKTAV